MPEQSQSDVTRTCVLLGMGGHAASVLDVLESAGWSVALAAGRAPGESWPTPVVETDTEAISMASSSGARVLAAVGDNTTRCMINAAVPEGLRAPAIFASSATVARSASIRTGTVVHHHAHVGPRSTIGGGVIINTAAVVEHDCTVADGAHIAPGAVLLGGVTVGRQTLIGSGARVLPGVRVGDRAIVGAGAIVHRDVPDDSKVVGVPARGGDL